MSRANNMEKSRKFGASEGATFLLFTLMMAGVIGWAVTQFANLLAGVVIGVLFSICSGTGGDLINGFHRLSRGLFRQADTRDRALAMEEYHNIEYVDIPNERLYVKSGEKLELNVYTKSGKKRFSKTLHGKSDDDHES